MANIQFTVSNIDLEEFTAKRTILKMSLGIILVFDLGKPETFQQLKAKMPEIAQHAGFIPIILVGTNKEAETEGVVISSMDIDQFMFKYGIANYFRISTQTGENIQRAFEALSEAILKENIRKLGIEEVRGKKNFNFTVSMIGAESIRKDLISESGVQHFIAPSAIGGALSRKSFDMDIHHLFEPKKETTSTTTPVLEERDKGVKSDITELKEIQEDIKGLSDDFAADLAKQEKITQAEDTSLSKDEPILEKPTPLRPMDFKKSEEKSELSPELKSSIREEVDRLRGIISEETPKMKKEDSPPPPPPPPSEPPAQPPAQPPKKALKSPPSPAAPKPKDHAGPPSPPAGVPTPPPSSGTGPVEKDSKLREELLEELHKVKEANKQKKYEKKKKAKTKRKSSIRGRRSAKPMVMDTLPAESKPEPSPIPASESVVEDVMDEFKHEEEIYEDDEGRVDVGYGLAGGAEKAPKEMEVTTEKLLRKTTVFYRERMNPETLNKLAVVLSTEKIYEKLKIKIEEVARAATDKALEIDKDVPIVEVIPEFPGCVCVPSMRKINAEKEYDTASFLITPLQTGEIPDACVKLYHKGKLIETVPTPTKVVKTTAAKVSAGVAVVVPLLSSFPIIYNPISTFLGGLIPFYTSIGELEGIVLILTGLFALISGIFYLFKRPKDAKPVETFPEIDEKLYEEN